MNTYFQLQKKQIQFQIASFVKSYRYRFFILIELFGSFLTGIIVAAIFYQLNVLTGLGELSNWVKCFGLLCVFLFFSLLAFSGKRFDIDFSLKLLKHLGALPEYKDLIFFEIEHLKIEKEKEKLEQTIIFQSDTKKHNKVLRHKI